MSLSCWRAIGSPKVNHSPAILKAFDGHEFQPYGLLPAIQVKLGGKSVSIHIKVVDAPLDYNLLLGRNWFDAMQAVASTFFQIVQFDQLDFLTPNAISNDANNVPLLTTPQYHNIIVGLIKYSSLIGVFPF